MIWSDARVIPDGALTIAVDDRTFEHGLGLFETLRTWEGRPTLLEKHNARMLRSADELGIPIDPACLPDDRAVRTLLEAEGQPGDRMLRITATGGTASGKSVVWMRSTPLPPPSREGGAIVCVNAWSPPIAEGHPASPLPPGGGPGVRGVAPPAAPEFASRRGGLALPITHDRQGKPYPAGESNLDRPPDDFTARHKTLNYWFKRLAHEHARALGYDETLIHLDPWGFAEASRANLFLVVGDELITPSTDAPIVPGIMRELILDLTPLKPQEVRSLDLDRLRSASELFLTNAVRGIIPVARVDAPSVTIERAAPGRWTRALQDRVDRRLRADRGDAP